jgi:hypothetical protein
VTHAARSWSRRLPLVAALALLGCSSAPAPAPPVAEQSALYVSSPLRFGWVSSAQPSGALPSAVALGGAVSGRVLLYFEFPALTEPGRLLRAELALETDGTPGDACEVELSRADAARGELRGWADQPHALYPRLTAKLESQGSPARLDVTELLRAQTKAGEPLRLLLRAEPGRGAPVLVRTGAAGGAAPRLEAYWE